ncbi:MAG: hypothetical protein NTV86_21595 [Planctomycetota bacterium]|nr:hypothetical protein [Planctomycetota bacterium]
MRTLCGTLVLSAAVFSGGCDRMNMNMMQDHRPSAVAATPAIEPDRPARYNPPRVNPPVVVREEGSDTAVDKALDWAQKYMEVSAKLTASEKENRALTEKSQALQQQLDTNKAQLAAAQKELNEANAMLKELETRLTKWQENVLGYRQEMREAQKAQMEAMARVIKLLGGEVPAAGAAGAPAPQAPALAGKEAGHAIP